MRRCADCGHGEIRAVNFCSQCGGGLKELIPLSQATGPKTKDLFFWRNLFLVLFAALLLLVALAAYFEVRQNQFPQEEEEESELEEGFDGYSLNTHRRYYTEGELGRLSADELRLAINEIYARHGRGFKDPEWERYFSLQPWYHVNSNYPMRGDQYDDAKVEREWFNQYEKANFKLLVSLREQKK